MPNWAITLIVTGILGILLCVLFWTDSRNRKRQAESKKSEKKEPTTSRYKSYHFFPLTKKDDTYVSWSVDKRLEGPYLITENIIRQEMYGGFTHQEVAFAVISGLLERGWLPPGMTADDVKQMKEDIDKNRQTG